MTPTMGTKNVSYKRRSGSKQFFDRASTPVKIFQWILFILVVSGVVGSTACDGQTDQTSETLDLVISAGRVMDPESGFDAIRNVGILDGQIVALTETPLEGRERLDASGLIVAPGFIDLHAHGQDLISNQYQARDGVTTALELEVGVYPISRWYASRQGQSLINYGASVGHQMNRQRAMASPLAVSNSGGTFSLGESSDSTLYRAPTPDELAELNALMEDQLKQGGLGFGFGLSYTPGVTENELLDLFGTAAKNNVPVYVHLPSRATFPDSGPLGPLQKIIAIATTTATSVHVVHLNSSAGELAQEAMEMIRKAQNSGLDITTEAYPYTASASLIESPLFDSWTNRPSDQYQNLQWVETSERLTPETFQQYRRQGGWVIIHGRSEETNSWIVSQPDILVASDGIPFLAGGRSHPRGAGTFARVLGHYTRDREMLSLMEALRKMTLLPALRLEQVAPQMINKGRVKIGGDADLTLFDPEQILDRATYENPNRFSEGISHVLVAGTFVVRDGELIDGIAPGQPIIGRIAESP